MPGKASLYNTITDARESKDLSNQLPERVADMKKNLLEYLKSIDAVHHDVQQDQIRQGFFGNTERCFTIFSYQQLTTGNLKGLIKMKGTSIKKVKIMQLEDTLIEVVL